MKDIVIIANFCDGPNENSNNRFNYIAKLISESGNSVELITSDFSHRSKKKRIFNLCEKDNYKITMLEEPTYKKNISIKRFFAHHKFSKNVRRYLEKRKKPDVIYCAIPSLSLASIALKYSKRNNIRFILDIQDLWPEAFKMIFNIPVISDILFYPMKIIADNIYKNADYIVAVSKTYKDRAMLVRKKNEKDKEIAVYLGTDLNLFENISDDCIEKKGEKEFWIMYVGTLGHSYDIEMLIDAVKILTEQGLDNIKLILIGDGPLKTRFELYSLNRKVNAKFIGRLEYTEMIKFLIQGDVAINPIVEGAAGSIINKVADYAAAGLPVLNTQNCNEYKKLLEKWECGLSSESGNAEMLAKNIMFLYNDKKVREYMGRRSKELANEKFNRSRSYKKIVNLILGEMI